MSNIKVFLKNSKSFDSDLRKEEEVYMKYMEENLGLAFHKKRLLTWDLLPSVNDLTEIPKQVSFASLRE